MITYDIYQLFPKFILRDKNGYAMAKAIKAALDYFLNKCQDGIDTVLNVDKMPEWRLDEMAWEYNVPYDYTARIEQKREWVRKAIPMYRILGTKEAILQYLEGYFGEVEVEENWQYSGDPFHFRVTVGGEWTPDTEDWATEAVNRVKSLRSILDDMRIGCKATLAITATGEIKERFQYPSAGELWAGEYPTENVKWEIDETPKAGIHAEDIEGRVAYDMAGEKPEINHLLSLDNNPMQDNEAEEIVSTIYYPLCGEPICGE